LLLLVPLSDKKRKGKKKPSCIFFLPPFLSQCDNAAAQKSLADFAFRRLSQQSNVVTDFLSNAPGKQQNAPGTDFLSLSLFLY
jgi:hypothetical protein